MNVQKWMGAAILVCGSGLLGQEAAVTIPAQISMAPELGGAFQTNGSFTEGGAFLVAPLIQTPGGANGDGASVLFFQSQYSFVSGDGFGASLGLAYRASLGERGAGLLSEGAVFGVNLFSDLRRTAADHQFWQLGVGLEADSRFVSVRANGYIPMSERKQLGYRVYAGNYWRQTATPTSYSDAVVSYYDLWNVYEEPMGGWDLEVGIRPPGLEQLTNVQLLLGYGRLEAESGALGAEIEGWRLGVEWRPVPAVALSVMWLEDQRYRGENWIAGLRMTLPLGDRQALKDAFTFQRSTVKQRMTQPVVRQAPAIQMTRTAARSETELHASRFEWGENVVYGYWVNRVTHKEGYEVIHHHVVYEPGAGVSLDLLPASQLVHHRSYESAVAAGMKAGSLFAETNGSIRESSSFYGSYENSSSTFWIFGVFMLDLDLVSSISSLLNRGRSFSDL
ncbi:MAG: inverse autotransporter beta domain-containing protein [Verrucomicrobiales bacterium]|nr:inverse autotransporter beta domain-containing protein [Verrucomicrobiales bacterium]